MRRPGIFRRFWIFFSLRIGQSCTVKVGGEIYDLSALQTAGKNGIVTVTPPESEQGSFKYEASFCDNLVTCQAIEANFVRLRVSNSDSCLGRYGDWDSAKYTKTENGFDAGLQTNDWCSDNYHIHHSSTFKFICDEGAGSLGTIEAQKDGDDTCSYSVSVYTNIVCAGSGPTQAPAPHNGSSSAGGLSWGSIFLIALVVSLFIYITLGVSLKYKKDQRYETPHKDFWCSRLPYLTKVGCITSWIWTLWCCQVSYSWCCIHICKRQKGGETTALIDGEEDH